MLPKEQTGRFSIKGKGEEKKTFPAAVAQVNPAQASLSNRGNIGEMLKNSPSIEKTKNVIQNLTDIDRSYRMLPISKIQFNDNNKNFNSTDTEESLEIFAQSIPTPKDLRNPIRVNHRKDGSYVLVSGERRLKAFIYHRDKLLEENPALKATGWDFIKAYVHEGLDEFEEIYELNAENVQSRELTPEQRFIAMQDMIKAFESKSQSDLTAEEKEKIMNLLGVSKRTLQVYLRLHKAAGEFDLFLLNNGTISFTEFKKRTEATIKANRETENKIAAVSIDRIVEKNYFDENSGSVLYVDKIYDERESRDMFCVYSINEHSNYAVHRPNLGNYPSRNAAQYALDIYASDNRWPEYLGDFSEFRKESEKTFIEEQVGKQEKQSHDKQTGLSPSSDSTDYQVSIFDSAETTDNSNDDFERSPKESGSPKETFTNREESFGEHQIPEENNEEITSESKIPEGIFEDSVDESKVSAESIAEVESDPGEIELSEEIFPDDNSDLRDSEDQNAADVRNSNPIADESKNRFGYETKFNDPVCHFEGENLNGITVRGALFVTTAYSENKNIKNDRIYIVSGIEFGKSLGNGKFEGRCLLEEVQKGTVRRIDDIVAE